MREGKIAFHPVNSQIMLLQPVISEEDIFSSEFHDCQLNCFHMCLSTKVKLETGSDNMGYRSSSIQGSISIPNRDSMFKRFPFQIEFCDGFFIDARNGTS